MYGMERSPVQQVAYSILEKIPALFHPAIKKIPGEMGATINTMLYGNPFEAHEIARRAIETIQAIIVADSEFIYGHGHSEASQQWKGNDSGADGLGEEHADGDDAQDLLEQLSDGESPDYRLKTPL